MTDILFVSREILAVEEDLDLNARGEEDLTALQLAM